MRSGSIIVVEKYLGKVCFRKKGVEKKRKKFAISNFAEIFSCFFILFVLK